MMQLLFGLLSLAMLGTLALGGAGWLLVLVRVWRGEPAVAWNPRPFAQNDGLEIVWSFIDILLTIMAIVLLSTAAFALVVLVNPKPLDRAEDKGSSAIASTTDSRSTENTVRDLASNVAGSVATMLACVLSAIWIMLRTHTSPREMGLWSRKLVDDVKVGVLTLTMFAPIVYGIQYLLVQIFGIPSAHPLIEGLKQNPNQLHYWGVFFMASVAAPLTEEYLFRMLLQGWLEKLFAGKKNPLPAVDVAAAAESGNLPNPASLSELAPTANPYAAFPSTNIGHTFGDSAATASDLITWQQRPWPTLWQNWLPILISATVFGLMHLGHGPDWVPLIILAIGLGYIYQRTHSLWPSVIVHGLFNSISMVALWIQLFVSPENLHKMQ